MCLILKHSLVAFTVVTCLVSSVIMHNVASIETVHTAAAAAPAAPAAHSRPPVVVKNHSLSPTLFNDTSPHHVHNWAWSYLFDVAKIIKPSSAADIASIVRDTKTYPGPVRALGSIHSVTECVVSNGTIVDMRGFDKIIGLRKDVKGRQLVTVQGGVKLISLHKWLGEHDLELPFSAEIGDATVGSLASSLSKDSGVGNLTSTGTLYKLITSVTYVNHNGDVITLSDKTGPGKLALASFKSSDGMLGIVTEVALCVGPPTLVTFSNYVMPTKDVLAAFKNGSFEVTEEKNYWILLHPNYSMVQVRAIAGPDVRESDAKTIEIIANLTRASFGKGMVSNLNAKGAEQKPIIWTTYRRNMVNHYEPADQNASRLDFTWFEYPTEKFQDLVPAYVRFWEDFRDKNEGFQPTGAAIYFVYRIPEKPSGWFSQTGAGFETPGLSFTLDPIYQNPNDPTCFEFLKQSITFAHAHGGRMALTQTRFVTPEDYLAAPGNAPVQETPNHRFTTAFFQAFIMRNGTVSSNSTAISADKPKVRGGQGKH